MPYVLIGIIASGVLVAMTMLNSPYGLTSLEYTKVTMHILPTQGANELIRGSFSSPDEYLGILFIPFRTSSPLPESPVEFRLYNKSTRSLVHSHEYVAKNFSDKPLFPFGIPVITKSKEVEYEFVIEAVASGSGLHNLQLDPHQDISTIHLFDRRELKRNNILDFFFNKVVQTFSILTFKPIALMLIGSLMFPYLIRFLIQVGVIGRTTSENRALWILTNVLAIAVLVLVPRAISDGVYVLWILFYTFITVKLKNSIKSHYQWALTLLVLCPTFLMLSDELRAEKSAIFVFFFLCFGVGHELITVFRFPSRYNQTDETT